MLANCNRFPNVFRFFEKIFFLLFVAIDFFYVADIEIVVAYFDKLLQLALDRHTAVQRDLDIAVRQLLHLHTELGDLIRLSARCRAATYDDFRDLLAGGS